MAVADLIEVKKLNIDLTNYRTVPQKNELRSIHALVAIDPIRFWALAISLLDGGYHLTENILVLKYGKMLSVREGNRRIAALKIILGFAKVPNLEIPAAVAQKIGALTDAWKKENSKVPCAVYDSDEISRVDKIVSLTHGKGEYAGRAQWNAVAKARHSRDSLGINEWALNLLEDYIKKGTNISKEQAERWAGEYPLSVLDEAVRLIAPRIGFASPQELMKQYPNMPTHRNGLEAMMLDIGLESLGFPALRNKGEDFAHLRYGFPSLPAQSPAPASGAVPANGQVVVSVLPANAPPPTPTKKTKAVPITDSRAVKRALRDFHPKGKNREKLVTLLNEARGLSLRVFPHSFCFLLRSMFELSAKAYCKDHAATGGPSATKAGGEDKNLVDVLRDVTNHLTKNNQASIKPLHGPMAELAKPNGFLSVTSMNQLIHNPKFSIDETHICTLFFNIFPLLEAMNK